MKNKVLNNASWIVGCRIIQSLISFVIGMVTARYLGPSKYGLISYATSVVAFFQPIVKLGFDSTLVQELICAPEDEGKILGTSMGLSLIVSLFSVLGVFVFVFLVNAGEKDTISVCFLYSILLVFQACEMAQYWFQAKLMSKYSSVSALVAYFCVAVYKVCILISRKKVQWFAVSHVIEVAMIAAVLLIIYKRKGGSKLAFSITFGKKMLDRSHYYIWAGLMLIVFQQTDRIMLKLMLGEAETGFYSAALTCVGIPAFVFGAIIDSARPSILEGHSISKIEFEKRLILLLSIITFLSIGQSLMMTVFAKFIVFSLYGSVYATTVPVLQIVVWYIVFGYYGMVRDIWILAKGKQKWLLYINLTGAISNVIGNLLLIPLFGACGAAIASVITQLFTNCILCFIVRPMRTFGRLLISSLNPQQLLKYYAQMKRND